MNRNRWSEWLGTRRRLGAKKNLALNHYGKRAVDKLSIGFGRPRQMPSSTVLIAGALFSGKGVSPWLQLTLHVVWLRLRPSCVLDDFLVRCWFHGHCLLEQPIEQLAP